MESKLHSDLNFIRSLSFFCEQETWRVVLYGGYGLDFSLGRITRPHRDVDAVIFGKNDRAEAIEKITGFLLDKMEEVKVVTKNEDFLVDIDVTASNFAANLYYVQTVNDPQTDVHAVLKQSGEKVVNSEERFPYPVKAALEDIVIEVQDQNAHLADILVKQSESNHHVKHDQDIDYLRQITDEGKVEALRALHGKN